ncbi:MAG: RodZ domain-containing protein [Alphaproteobacteria bacterium]
MVRLNPRSFRVLNQDNGADIMHSVEGADHVGAFLREARETTGRTVADVAQNLRIRRVYLEAIEDGRFDELPGATYAVGFVRSYAAYLRLDAPTLVARFKEEASGIQAPQELEFPMPVPEGRFPGGLLVTICLLVGAAAFGGWYWVQSQNGIEVARVPAPPGDVQESPETTASPPDSPASPAPSRVAAAAEPETIPFEGPTPAEPAIPEPATVDLPSADVVERNAGFEPAAPTPVEDTSAEAPATDTEVAVVTPAPAEFSSEPAIIAIPEIEGTQASASDNPEDREGRTYGARNAAARIILRAEENTWVQIRDADENVILTQMLQAGDRYLVPNRDGMRLMTGNAGGLDISVDGDSVPTIGERGESRRDVRLDPNLLKTGTAVVR